MGLKIWEKAKSTAVQVRENTDPSFWKKPEGKTGMVVLGSLGVGTLLVGGAVVPMVISGIGMAVALVGQTIVLGGMVALGAGAIYVGRHPKTRALLSSYFQSNMRKLTKAVVKSDPIGQMKNYAMHLEKELSTISSSRTSLAAQEIKLLHTITEEKSEFIKVINTLTECEKRPEFAPQAAENSKRASRLEASIVRNSTLLEEIRSHMSGLDQIYEACYSDVINITEDISHKEKQWEILNASHSAIRSAQEILTGGASTNSEMFREAIEVTMNDYSYKLAEIRTFVKDNTLKIKNTRLEKLVAETNATQSLPVWKERADKYLADIQAPIYLGTEEPSKARITAH